MRRALSIQSLEIFAMCAVFAAAIALSLIRLDVTDTPWHLATAKYAFSSGHWPVHNTFSYTHPEYPLFQQYPIYQSLLYGVYLIGGWEGLSLLHCVLWVAVFALLILYGRWEMTWRQISSLSLLWMLALLGLQRRMILRPEILTLLCLVLLLHLVEVYRRGRVWSAALFVAVQFVMVNSHQLFPLGLAVQGSLLAHLLAARFFSGRLGISKLDRELKVLPVVLALAGSVVVCFLSPLGTEIIQVPLHTVGSLYYHHSSMDEFVAFYTSRYDLLLVMFATVLISVAMWRRRKEWQPFDFFLWLIGAAVVLLAIRGVTLYVVVCVAIFARNFSDHQSIPTSRTETIWDERASKAFRIFCAVSTVVFSVFVIQARWFAPVVRLSDIQAGIGLSAGAYPHAAIKFLKENAPPGRMINLSWYSGNTLIWELFPLQRVFVDSRFESYPRDFLLKVVRAPSQPIVFEQLVSEYRPNWMVAEVRDADVRKMVARLLQDDTWKLVHADTIFLILVKNVIENSGYLQRHEVEPAQISPSDFLWSYPGLLAAQRLRMAELYADLGLMAEAREMVLAAEPEVAMYGEAHNELERVKKSIESGRTVP
jgi:hypothetical protein